MKLISLNREKDRRERRERDRVSADLRQVSREYADGTIDGYALVCWERIGTDEIATKAAWNVADIRDKFMVSDLVSQKIRTALEQ